MNKIETVLGILSIATALFTIFGSVWKLGVSVTSMQADLRGQIEASNNERRINDLRLEHLQDQLVLGFNGLKERLEHFSNRYRNEHRELSDRLRVVENIIQKKFEDVEL